MFGHTVKYIRNAKDIKQLNIAQTVGINQGTYSKFEKNQIDIRSTTFLEILKALDIPLEEFLFIHRNFEHTNQDELILQFFNSPYHNIDALTDMKLKCEKLLLREQKVSSIISDICVLCDALLLILKDHNFEQAKQLVKPIWDRLCKHNDLFLYDIYLMNAMLFLFPLDEIFKIKDFLERSISKYINYQNVNRLSINLKLNIGILCIAEQKYKQGLVLIEAAIVLASETKAFVQLAIAYTRKGICLRNQGATEGDRLIQKGLDILEVIEEYETIEFLKKEIRFYTK